MRNYTYTEFFDETLKERIEMGGPLQVMIGWVTALIQQNQTLRDMEFRQWIEEESTFRCNDCMKTFTPDLQSVQEDHPILCPRCRR